MILYPFLQIISPTRVQTTVSAHHHICIIHVILFSICFTICETTQTSSRHYSIIKQSIITGIFLMSPQSSEDISYKSELSIADFPNVFLIVIIRSFSSDVQVYGRYKIGSIASPSFVIAKYKLLPSSV